MVPQTKRSLTLLILLLALLSGGTAVAQEASPGLSLQAEAGYDGFYKADDPLPVRITAANDGPPVEGSLRIIVGSGDRRIVHTTPISLPTQSNKQVTMYVHLPNFTRHLDVELVDESGRVIAAAVSNELDRIESKDLLYGVVSDNIGQLDLLEDIPGEFVGAEVAYLGINSLPDVPAAWNALNVLIFNDVDAGRLSADQRAALTGWLGLGGQLIVTGGPGWQQTAAPFADLLPVTPTGLESVSDLPALLAATGVPFRDPGPYLVTAGSLTSGGRSLLQQDGLPLLAVRRHGRGAVTFLALDPQLAPLADWDGSAALWEEIAGRIPQLPYWAGGVTNAYAAASAVSSLPGLALPSVADLLLFLLVYILVVGPINYLVLKRIGRRELAWLTIPAAVIIFSAIPYLVGFQLKGNDTIINQMAIAYGRTDGEAMRVQTIVGLYSPRRARYDLLLPSHVVVRPFDRNFGSIGGVGNIDAISRGNQVAVEDIRVDVSGVEMFVVDSYEPLPDISGQATLKLEDGQFKLDVDLRNDGDARFENAHLLLGAELIDLGDLEPGAAVSRSRSLTGADVSATTSASAGRPPAFTTDNILQRHAAQLIGTPNYYQDAEAFPRFQLLEALGPGFSGGGATSGRIPRGTATLIAWSDAHHVDVDLRNRAARQTGVTLYFLELPLTDVVVTGQDITVPDALFDVQILGESGGGFFQSGDEAAIPPGTWLELEFLPWPQFQALETTGLSLDLDVETGSGSTGIEPSVRLYDWDQELWVEVEGMDWERPFPIPNFERYVGPGNAVRLRLQNDSNDFLTVSDLTPELTGDAE